MASSLNTPDVLTQPIAENGDKNTIPATNDQSLGQMSQSTGFPAICSERIADGGKAPRRADFNGAFNMLSRYIYFNQNGGVETFRADVSTAIGGYPKDAILGYKTATDFKLVRSLVANNTYNFNTNPSYIDDGTHWESVIPMSKNISNWSSNVTNCITEIPQDIKLELNNGTLTLKAGSKVHVPNGAGVFDEITVTNDISVTTFDETGQTMVVIASDQSVCYGNQYLNYWYSGTTPPSTGMFYNTSTNYIDYYSGGSIIDGHFSFPLAIITVNNGSITSVDQVFNGFGYIGSTVFVLPGVKGLIPNGRNVDGTLNNTPFYVENVLTKNPEAGATTIQAVFTINGSGLQDYSAYQEKHDFTNNYNYAGSNKINRISFAYCTVTAVSRKISNFRTKLAFDVVNHNDIANLAMPSDRYIDLTLGASETQYTAPADGYVAFCKQSSGGSQLVYIEANAMMEISWAAASFWDLSVNMPVKKGDTFTVGYSAGENATKWFRFVYAQGA